VSSPQINQHHDAVQSEQLHDFTEIDFTLESPVDLDEEGKVVEPTHSQATQTTTPEPHRVEQDSPELLASETPKTTHIKRKIWLKRTFTLRNVPSTEYLTINEFSHWQTTLSLHELRPIVASILNAELRVLANQVECLDLLADGHQETSTRVYIDDFNASRLILKYEHWCKKSSGFYYKTAQGSVTLGYGVRCLERWLELPFPVEMIEKIRAFLNS
jgi:hypothetical protein